MIAEIFPELYDIPGRRVLNPGANARRMVHSANWVAKWYWSMSGRNSRAINSPFVECCPWLQHFTPLTGSAVPGDKSVAFVEPLRLPGNRMDQNCADAGMDERLADRLVGVAVAGVLAHDRDAAGLGQGA